MNKNILIAGATSGLGRQLAKLYAEDNCSVGIIGRREALLNEIQLQFPNRVKTLNADISKDDIGLKINQFINSMDGIDILIITASIIEFNENLDFESESRTVATNVKGYMQVINTAWHYFTQKGEGHIVGITSIASARGNKNAPAYHASKAFQSLYLESLRVKAKHEKNNITITELVPGYMNTDMGKGDRLFWKTTVEKAARQSAKAIARKRARAFITKRWWFVYHIQRLLPIFIYDALVNGSWKLKNKS